MQTDLMEQSTINIMDMCKSVLESNKITQQNHSHSPTSTKRSKSKQIQQNALTSKISPLQEQQNNKIIDKLRRKYYKKKQIKQIVIRKTDLGQNQMIFTKQELQKLKQIDDEEMFKFPIQKSNLKSTLQNNIQEKTQNQKNKYFFSPNFDKPNQEIEKYLNWVNLNQVKGTKDKNKKNKILNFQKREHSSTPNLLIGSMKEKLPFINHNPKNASLFGKPQNLKTQNQNKISLLMKKNSVDKCFLNSINQKVVNNMQKLTKQELLQQIVEKANQKIQKSLTSSASQKKFIYMTEERKQALFQCQVLRKVKRQMGPKFFNNLYITYGPKGNTGQNNQDEQNKQNHQDQNGMRRTHHGQGSKGFNKGGTYTGKQRGFGLLKQKESETQAERMIQKNMNRLKQERKRVIQKIVC